MKKLDNKIRKMVETVKVTGLEIEVEMEEFITTFSVQDRIGSLFVVIANSSGSLKYISAVDPWGRWTTSQDEKATYKVIETWAADTLAGMSSIRVAS